MMSERGGLFRDEALEFRARARETPGTVVRLGGRWVRWSYWLVLVLLAVGVGVAIRTHTTTTTSGVAVVNGRDGTFSTLLPAVVAPQLRGARALRVDLAPPGAPTLSTKVTRARAVEPNTAVSGLPRPVEPSILLTGRVIVPAGARSRIPAERRIAARATVVLRSERLGSVIVRQLKGMFVERGST